MANHFTHINAVWIFLHFKRLEALQLFIYRLKYAQKITVIKHFWINILCITNVICYMFALL